MNETDAHTPSADWTNTALLVAAGWVALALSLSFLLRVDWLARGDFDYRTAMYYHALMVPLLVMVYLAAVRTLGLGGLARSRAYALVAVVAVALAGIGSAANSSEGLSAAALAQIAGMTLTDVLGLVLIFSLANAMFGRDAAEHRPNAAHWLLLCSLAAVILAAPLGHLAGWGIDIGVAKFPGVSALTKRTGVPPSEFQDALVGSHSHLIVAATLSALVALAARLLGYESLRGWRRNVSRVGLWLALAGVVGAAAIYLISALVGWEPPAVFVGGAHGENGMPFDDVILAAAELGWVLLIIGLAWRPADGREPPVDPWVKWAIVLNVAFGFVAAVGVGVYIEFHETFYGGGEAPAPGAANDAAYIRAHLLYAFMLLPIVLTFLVALGGASRSRVWPRVCAGLSMLGMALGLVGEFVWVGALTDAFFLSSMIVLDVAIIAGAMGLIGLGSLGESEPSPHDVDDS